MSEPERKRRGPITLFCESRRLQRIVIAVVILLPAVYLASTGPAVWIAVRAKSEPLERALAVIYAPILWLYENCPAFVPAWDWWADIWDGE